MASNERHLVRIYAKDPDELGEMASVLGWSARKTNSMLEFGEYATFDVEVDSDGKIVGGRIVPVKEARRW